MAAVDPSLALSLHITRPQQRDVQTRADRHRTLRIPAETPCPASFRVIISPYRLGHSSFCRAWVEAGESVQGPSAQLPLAGGFLGQAVEHHYPRVDQVRRLDRGFLGAPCRCTASLVFGTAQCESRGTALAGLLRTDGTMPRRHRRRTVFDPLRRRGAGAFAASMAAFGASGARERRASAEAPRRSLKR